jgi:hypothetical protein
MTQLDRWKTTMSTRPYPLAKPLAGNPHPIVPKPVPKMNTRHEAIWGRRRATA